MHRVTLACALVLLILWVVRILPGDEPDGALARRPAGERAHLPAWTGARRDPGILRDDEARSRCAGPLYVVSASTREDSDYLCVAIHEADVVTRRTLGLALPTRAARPPTQVAIVESQSAAGAAYRRLAGSWPRRTSAGYHLPERHALLIVDADPIEPVIAREVALAVLGARVPGAPPFFREGLAAHVATWADQTWSDARRLDAWAQTARSTGVLEPAALSKLPADAFRDPDRPQHALYALLFVDMLAYADQPLIGFVVDPGLRDLLPAYCDRAAQPDGGTPEQLFLDVFDTPDVRRRWREYLSRFGASPLPTPSYR